MVELPLYTVCIYMMEEELHGGEELTVKIRFPEGGNLDHKFWVKNSEKAFRFCELTSKSGGNPQFSTEILMIPQKSLIAVWGGKLYERGKYQPEIQFPEGGGMGGGNHVDTYGASSGSSCTRIQCDNAKIWCLDPVHSRPCAVQG